MASTYESILKDLRAGNYKPVYFLNGEEPFYIDQLTEYFLENILEPGERDFNLTLAYGKDTKAEDVKNACTRYPMMAKYNLVVIKEAQEIRKWDELEKYLENPVESTILVLCHKHKKADKRTKFYKTLKKNAVILETKKLYENKIPQWVAKYVEKNNFQISDKAAYLLAEYLGNDLSKLSNELDKLMIDDKIAGKIDTEAIERNIGINKDYNAFELTDALGSRNVEKTTRIVNYMSANTKTNPLPMITAILYGYFSKITALESSKGQKENTAKQAGIPPFKIKDHIKAFQLYRGRLNTVLNIIQDADLKFKGIGGQTADEASLMRETIYKILYV